MKGADSRVLPGPSRLFSRCHTDLVMQYWLESYVCGEHIRPACTAALPDFEVRERILTQIYYQGERPVTNN